MANGKSLHILHFNDVYEVGARSREPVGGATRYSSSPLLPIPLSFLLLPLSSFILHQQALSYHPLLTIYHRFSTAVQSFAELNPLILFAGDVFNPSVLSTTTKGKVYLPLVIFSLVLVLYISSFILSFVLI